MAILNFSPVARALRGWLNVATDGRFVPPHPGPLPPGEGATPAASKEWPRLVSACGGVRFPLSLGERAGVRGKAGFDGLPRSNPSRVSSSRIVCALFILSFLLQPLAALADDALPRQFAPRFERAYTEAVERARQQSNDVTVAWELGRACFDLAEFATNNSQRAPLAERGIAACRRAIALDSNSAPAHYYLALNCGQLARVKLFSALGLLDQMEAAFLRSIEIDSRFDYAGAHRALGILYRDAPGWPTSIGSKKKARVQLEKAVELHPEYPGNRLNLLDSLLQWGEKKTVQSQVSLTDAMLKSARGKFTGEPWAFDWHDWDRLWQKIRAKTGVVQARSPKDQSR